MKRKADTHDTQKKQLFKYGNYPNYYSYRNPGDLTNDARLQAIPDSIFKDAVCLDIGCNTGIITIELAKRRGVKQIIGVDIDTSLIRTARQNLYFASSLNAPNYKTLGRAHRNQTKENYFNYFPTSMPILYGTIPCTRFASDPATWSVISSVEKIESNQLLKQKDVSNDLKAAQKEKKQDTEEARSELTQKVLFFVVDWVSEDTNWMYSGEYDVVFALSITKWIHLNHGDAGIESFFKKVYDQLKKGGYFLVEPQPWSGYHKRTKISEDLQENYKSIKLYPEMFGAFLCEKVGFSDCKQLDVAPKKQNGFCRPLLLLRK